MRVNSGNSRAGVPDRPGGGCARAGCAGHQCNRVAYPFAAQAQRVGDHAQAFDAAVGVLNNHAPGTEQLIIKLLRKRQLLFRGLLVGHLHHDPGRRVAQQAQILVQHAAGRQEQGLLAG